MSAAFGALLGERRRQHGLSQGALAEAADLDPSYLSRLESGARLPSREAAARLAAALRLEPRRRRELLAAAGFVEKLDPLVWRLAAALDGMGVSEEGRQWLTRTVEEALQTAGAARASERAAAGGPDPRHRHLGGGGGRGAAGAGCQVGAEPPRVGAPDRHPGGGGGRGGAGDQRADLAPPRRGAGRAQPAALRAVLVRVAAVCAAMVEQLDEEMRADGRDA